MTPVLPRTIRAFVALDVPPDLKRAITSLQREMGVVRGARVTWPRPEGIHLTLKFLGDIDRDQLPELTEALAGVSRSSGVISLATTITGGFPRIEKPRILWLGLQENGELLRLQSAVEEACFELGYPLEEKPFHPHLTVGRVKDIDRVCELPSRYKAVKVPRHEWSATELLLMMSDLRPEGAVYTALARLPLGSASN